MLAACVCFCLCFVPSGLFVSFCLPGISFSYDGRVVRLVLTLPFHLFFFQLEAGWTFMSVLRERVGF